MNIKGTKLEDVLIRLLQKNINLSFNNKPYKKGKLILFKQNNYYLELTIEKNNKENKRIELPTPFNIELWENDNLIYFDYRFPTLAKSNNELRKLLYGLPQEGNNRFYDSILEIEIVPEVK